jgi:cholesterol transport system auxiliary component
MTAPVTAIAALLLAAPMLAGCGSALLGGSPPALDTITLGADPGNVKFRASRRQILVAEPKALKIHDSQSIVVSTGGANLEYLGGTQWADRLPGLVQVKLAEALQDAGARTGLPGQGLAIDYQLITEIRDFSIVADGADRARVIIHAKLLNDRSGNVIASKLFSAETPASPGAYPSALNAAFGIVTGDITKWVAART